MRDWKFAEIKPAGWRRYINSVIAAEISTLTRYFDRLVQWRPHVEDHGTLFQVIDCAEKSIAIESHDISRHTSNREDRTAVLLNGNFNHSFDIQEMLSELKLVCNRGTRIVAVLYNPYLRWLYRLANRLGIRRGELPETFLTETDLRNLARISGFEIVRMRPIVFSPYRLFGLGDLVNRVLPTLPLIRWMSIAALAVLRPVIKETSPPSVSILIPARNEKGNIENALKRLPTFATRDIEVIFVEGHSKDGTWEEIQRVIPLYSGHVQIKAFKQTGKGKCDAVRLGFSHATKDLLVILDADLTMPPELLPRFYDAYADGLADFVNGSRLLYPMEGEAMRFLNRLGNIFFAKALSVVMGVAVGDSLCGTKLVARRDYERFRRWRNDFGDFDPFGDFELLFPASELGLGFVDIAIRYRDRTYGSTNISRFYHGMMLLRMTAIGFLRIKLGKVPQQVAGGVPTVK